ncbi:lysophospholipid acyltransferase family protein [Lutimonas zeaxanthinifaciens]|uniref:lysophospholipid acyltransferase family protein n=1 Tax=Lutimonas zeaxanthinifaciens TaxID=3060215 RepID=UPI00265CF036|nr:lipid A biosynthesis acyltransferase [Lutimonas sp. YSD2104]WKK67464.1 lipid A biosynthesis acyltransferase [Lutimonas sp. YSD2104]
MNASISFLLDICGAMLQLITYIFVYPFIVLISILPFRILYLLSDGLFFILYHVLGYRKKVVMNNLKIAFPDKPEAELKKIRKEFFHHFLDIFMEMIKTFSISNEEILRRFKLTNPEELKAFMDKHENILLMSSHYGNFEWLFSLNLRVEHHGFAAYKKVKNKYFNDYIVRSRSKFNTTLVPTKQLIEQLAKNDATGDRYVYGMLVDQSPKLHKTYHWSNFFGVEVPVITGTEMLAKKYDYAVMYIETAKIRRGFYETKMEILSENPREVPDFGITDLFMKKLEAHITREPAYYFWSHKRFKHMRLNKEQEN